MRLVKKQQNAPDALVKCFKEKITDLLEKREGHDFDARCYRDTCKTELFDLYHGKCAYCERQIVTRDDDGNWSKNIDSLTIDHYRPKKRGYYWLGYEWTNLFPTCEDCNSPKGGKFEIRGKKTTCPAINGNLDTARCHVCCDELMAEKPLFLHPELDDPTAFFELNRAGKFVSLPSNKERADYTYKNTSIKHHALARKKVLDELVVNIEGHLFQLAEEVMNSASDEVTDKDLRSSFFPIFQEMQQDATNEKIEFTFVRRQAFRHMDELLFEQVANKIDPIFEEWLYRALLLFAEKNGAV